MNLNQQHFDKLVACVTAIRGMSDLPESVWIGPSSRDWLCSVKKGKYAHVIDCDPDEFSNTAYNRQQLHDNIAAAKQNLTDRTLRDLVIDILAWGGMSAKNARLALKEWDCWKHPCADLAAGLPAADAYSEFYRLQHNRSMKGIGPAYYTKLIYFLGSGDGLIMDQWTSRSMNLLFGNFIKITKDWKSLSRGTVDLRNNADIYRQYLDGVNLLSRHLSNAIGAEISPSQTEEFIFSITWRKKVKFLDECQKVKFLDERQQIIVSAWRKYVTRPSQSPAEDCILPPEIDQRRVIQP